MRNSVLIVGAEQSGKTYYAERIAEKYIKSGRTALIYNVGKDSDFADAEICEPVSIAEMMRNARTKKDVAGIKRLDNLPLFRDEKTGKFIPFYYFRKFYAGKMVKIYRVRDEAFLFKSFFLYLYDSLIIFDDNRATTRHGIGHELVELSSRKNHSGVKYASGKQGVDIFFIYHNLDTVPAELYDYINRAVMFEINRVPDKGKMQNDEFFEHISDAAIQLKNLPRFSNIELILRGHPQIKKIVNKHQNQ